VGQTVGAPYATQLGTASVEISTALEAQRSGSVRAASSGPTTLPQLRQAGQNQKTVLPMPGSGADETSRMTFAKFGQLPASSKRHAGYVYHHLSPAT
jgi:hypothetical protein